MRKAMKAPADKAFNRQSKPVMTREAMEYRDCLILKNGTVLLFFPVNSLKWHDCVFNGRTAIGLHGRISWHDRIRHVR